MALSISRRHDLPIQIWFVANALLLLLPPIHWLVQTAGGTVLGLPTTLFYFVFLSASTALSVVVAYARENAKGSSK